MSLNLDEGPDHAWGLVAVLDQMGEVRVRRTLYKLDDSTQHRIRVFALVPCPASRGPCRMVDNDPRHVGPLPDVEAEGRRGTPVRTESHMPLLPRGQRRENRPWAGPDIQRLEYGGSVVGMNVPVVDQRAPVVAGGFAANIPCCSCLGEMAPRFSRGSCLSSSVGGWPWCSLQYQKRCVNNPHSSSLATLGSNSPDASAEVPLGFGAEVVESPAPRDRSIWLEGASPMGFGRRLKRKKWETRRIHSLTSIPISKAPRTQKAAFNALFTQIG